MPVRFGWEHARVLGLTRPSIETVTFEPDSRLVVTARVPPSVTRSCIGTISFAHAAVTAIQVGLRALRRSRQPFISNPMFGPKHQIARKTVLLPALSRTYADFISDLKFGPEHQIQ